MSSNNQINYIFFFNINGKEFVKVIKAHKHSQTQAVKKLKEEFGSNINVTNVFLEGQQPLSEKSLPPIFTNI